MARYTGPKWKQSRREGVDLFGRVGSKYQKEGRTTQLPGVHGPKQYRSKPTGYSLQLREKQKAKRTYGVLERQFKHYYEEANKSTGNTADTMMQLLDRRLDNVIYRLGLAKTRPQARQLVSHGNVLVNDKKVDIPSFLTKIGDVVALSSKASKFSFITNNLDQKYETPLWLTRKGTLGKVERLPKSEETDLDIKYHVIVEYYSR
jgi:small subunit ribosomal protein S4